MSGYWANWGHDHRGCAVRIPRERGEGARVEHRLADGACGPHIATAATLFAARLGIRGNRKPVPGETGACLEESTAEVSVAPDLGRTLVDLEADKDLVAAFDARRAAGVVAVEEVPLRDTARYGVVDVGENPERLSRIASIIEKPAPEEAPSNLAVVGRYVFDAAIMDLLGAIAPGAGGEIQLTDAIGELAVSRPILASRFRGVRHDCGTPAGWLRATVAPALADAPPADPLARDLDALLADWRASAGAGP